MAFEDLKALASKHKIVLGSGSPRRVKLLNEIEIEFTQIKPEIEENQNKNELPYDFAERLACEKAIAVSNFLSDSEIVIGCDTIVVLENQVLGKPIDEQEAFKILSLLSGKMHTVCTAVALAKNGNILKSGFELTDVYFNRVSEKEIKKYIASGEPSDKAGAYGIQGMGAFLVDRIDGNLDNVIGLPRMILSRIASEIIKNLNE